MVINKITSLDLEMSDYCNAGCPLCPRHLMDTSTPRNFVNTSNTNINEIKRWFNKDNCSEVTGIFLCGNFGEPSLVSSLLEIIEYFKTFPKLEIIRLDTNGGTRNSDFWIRLGSMSDNKVTVQARFWLDGLEDTLHIYRRGVVYRKVINNAKSFMEGGGQAIWSFLEFSHNTHQKEEAERRAKEMGFSGFVSKKVNNTDNSKTLSSPDSYKRGEDKSDSVHCKVKDKVFVDSMGIVMPCCWIAEHVRECYPSFYSSKGVITNCVKKSFISDMIESSGGIYNFWLEVNSISEILSLPFYKNDMYDSLVSMENGFCVSKCGSSSICSRYKRKSLDVKGVRD